MNRMHKASRTLVRAFAIATFALIALMAGFNNAHAQQCTGNFIISNFNFGVNCDTIHVTPLWDGDSCVNLVAITSNGTQQHALCCMVSSTVFDGVRVFGRTIGVGKTEQFISPCGCIQISVTGPNGAGQYTITITRIMPPTPPC